MYCRLSSDLLLSALGVARGVTAVCSDDSDPGLARLLYLPWLQSVSQAVRALSLPIIDVDAFLSPLRAGSFLEFRLVSSVTTGTAQTATTTTADSSSWEERRGLLLYQTWRFSYRSRLPGRWRGLPRRSRRQWWREGRRWGETLEVRCCSVPSPGSSYSRPRCSRGTWSQWCRCADMRVE